MIDEVMELDVKKLTLEFDGLNDQIVEMIIKTDIFLPIDQEGFNDIMEEMKKPNHKWNLKFYIGVDKNG